MVSLDVASEAASFSSFEAELAAAVAAGAVAGAVALVTDGEGVVFETAAGVRSFGSPTPMDAATVFWLASMTKAVVSVAALQQVERGGLSLDGDLAGLLPEFADLKVLDGFETDGAPRLRPARRPVTLRHLLTHTSGFGYDFTSRELARWAETAGAPSVVTGLRAAHVQPLLFDPGERWAYGIGVDWAGLAVEAASGRRLDVYLAENVLGPLGMAETSFRPSPEQVGRLAGAHLRTPDGKVAPIPSPAPILEDPEVFSGGGGLYGTADDYGRFLRMLLNGGTLEGRQVLAPETVALLFQPQTGSVRAGAFQSANPMLTHDFDLFPDQPTGWGLAAMISPQAGPNGRGPGSLSWGGLLNTYYWADRAAGRAGVLMTQLLPFGDPAVLKLAGSLERAASALDR